MNSSNGYGFTDGRSCVLIRMIKVIVIYPTDTAILMVIYM